MPAASVTLETAWTPPLRVTEADLLGDAPASSSGPRASSSGDDGGGWLLRLLRPRLELELGTFRRSWAPAGEPRAGSWRVRWVLVLAGLGALVLLAVVGLLSLLRR